MEGNTSNIKNYYIIFNSPSPTHRPNCSLLLIASIIISLLKLAKGIKTSLFFSIGSQKAPDSQVPSMMCYYSDYYFEFVKLMSNEKQLKEEIHRLNQQLKRLQEEKEAQEHQSKKALIEANTKLDFQTRKADEYEEKYKAALQYKNQEESVKELDQKLRNKQDEIIKLMRLDHERAQEIQNLLQEVDELKRTNGQLESDLNQIKEAALNAIVDKDTTIGQLTDRLEEYQNSESINNINNLKAAIAEIQDKYAELEDKLENNRIEYIKEIEVKDEEINELHDRISSLKDKNDERVARLTEEIANYERHIEEITAERDHDQNYEEKYYHTEERLRKAEKKMVQFQQAVVQERAQLEHSLQKLQQENENLKVQAQQLKETRSKIAYFQKLTENIKNEWDEQKEKYQKQAQDNAKKILHLESEKKIISDNLQIKLQQIERLKTESEEKARSTEPTLIKQKSSSSLVSPHKISSEDSSSLVQKLKKQNKELEDSNDSLKRKIEQQMKQLQDSRQKLLQARSSDSSTEVNKLRVQIEDLTSYLKKVECDMLMKKITHAEDQNFWSIKEKKYKEEIETLGKKYKKQNSQLLQRIDRMKKLVPKDKKTDYYQSGFK